MGCDDQRKRDLFDAWVLLCPLKKYQKQCGVTRRFMCAKIGIHETTMYRYYRGDVDPRLSFFQRFGSALGVPARKLMAEYLDWMEGSPMVIGFEAFIDRIPQEFLK